MLLSSGDMGKFLLKHMILKHGCQVKMHIEKLFHVQTVGITKQED